MELWEDATREYQKAIARIERNLATQRASRATRLAAIFDNNQPSGRQAAKIMLAHDSLEKFLASRDGRKARKLMANTGHEILLGEQRTETLLTRFYLTGYGGTVELSYTNNPYHAFTAKADTSDLAEAFVNTHNDPAIVDYITLQLNAFCETIQLFGKPAAQ